MLRVKRNLLLVAMTVMLLVGLGTWVAFRFLVGEALVTAPDVGAKVRELAQPRKNTNEG